MRRTFHIVGEVIYVLLAVLIGLGFLYSIIARVLIEVGIAEW